MNRHHHDSHHRHHHVSASLSSEHVVAQTPSFMMASSEVLHPPGQPVAANGARMPMMEELRELRLLPEFTSLVDCIKKEKKQSVNVRQILSHHTSNACQPGKRDGTAGGGLNLKDAGLDNALPNHAVHVTLPNSYTSDDGLELDYRGEAARSKQEGRDACCMDILCYLLVGAPANVCMAPGPFINGGASVVACREAAQLCQTAHRQRMVGRQPVAARPLYELVDQLSGQRDRGNTEAPLEKYEPLGPNETQTQRDQQIVELLQKHLSAKAYSPSRLPNAAWSGLRRLLPRGGLAPFLKRHADIFDVNFDDHGKVEAFRFLRVEPPPGLTSEWRRAGHWPASGSQGPAGSGDGDDRPTSGSQVQGPRESEMVAFPFKDKLYLGNIANIGEDGQAHVDFGFYGTWRLDMESLWTCGESPPQRFPCWCAHWGNAQEDEDSSLFGWRVDVCQGVIRDGLRVASPRPSRTATLDNPDGTTDARRIWARPFDNVKPLVPPTKQGPASGSSD